MKAFGLSLTVSVISVLAVLPVHAQIASRGYVDHIASEKQATLTNTNVKDSGSGNVVTGVSAANGVVTISKGNVQPTLTNDNIKGAGSVSVDVSGGVVTVTGTEQVNADWNATTGVAKIENKPTLGDLAAKSKITESDINGTISQGKVAGLGDALNGKQDTLVATGTGKNIQGANGITVGVADGMVTITGTNQVNADWNATTGVAKIENKPTLGDLAAKSKITESDINGTISQGKVAGLGDALNGKQDTLVATGTGKNIQGANGITVGVADGMVTITGTNQVNADWNATSGVAKIENKPTLGDLAAKSKITESDINGTISQGKVDGLSTALSGKQPTLIGSGEGQNIKTIDGTSLMGSGNIDLAGNAAHGVSVTNNNGTITTDVAEATPSKFGVVKVGQIPSGSATSTTYATIWVE